MMLSPHLLVVVSSVRWFELFYTASEDDHVGTNGRGRRLQRPQIKYWLESATFDETGRNLGRRAVTSRAKWMEWDMCH